MARRAAATNPFRFGPIALDEAFTDRERELDELVEDMRNGQDVVVFAPRRYGKTSLVWRAVQEVGREGMLVAQVDVMTATSKAALAAKLARSIYDDVAGPLFRARERVAVFKGLRVRPTMTVDADDASVSFSFEAGHAAEDLDATLERLLELPAELAAERKRSVAVVLDEFQEVAELDPGLPRLMRAVFQRQPDVSHVYLGSRRHMLERIFRDANEPFWRSAKPVQLDVIAPERFAPYLVERFRNTGKAIATEAVDRLLEVTGGHPYATQELSYFAWQETPPGETCDRARVVEALTRVLQSEHAHFTRVWDGATAVQRTLLQALAAEPGRPLASEYRRRHRLPGPSTVQRALESLERDELVRRARGHAEIAEPFLAEWVRALGS